MIRSLCVSILTGFCLSAQAAEPNSQPIEFTQTEKTYIEHANAIKMCVDPDWVPFEHINAEGKHIGIAAELVQLVAQRVGLEIELYQTKTWEESLAASKSGNCQIMSFLNQTPARDEWLIFTEPIFFDPNIVITREEHPYIGDLRGLTNETVALPRGTMVEERIRRDYPNLIPILTENEQEAVALVSERKADMSIRSLIVAAYAIKKEGLFNLKIAGHVPDYTNKLRIGVIKDDELLRSILDKGVKTLTPQEREAISNKHVAISVQSEIDYALVFSIVGASALLLLIAVLWNRKLAYFNRRLKQLNLELERISETDKLTGLANRLKLDVVISDEINRASRFSQPFSIILIDIDNFKQVNDHYGHLVGDQVLEQLAKVLSSKSRKVDTAGRWGGEEFLIVCPNTEISGAKQLAEHLRSAIESDVFPVEGGITASFGISAFKPDDHVNNIVARADEALYSAKSSGRNRVAAR